MSKSTREEEEEEEEWKTPSQPEFLKQLTFRVTTKDKNPPQASFKTRNLGFREPLQTAEPPQRSPRPHYWNSSGILTTERERGLMVRVKCHVQCGLSTITNPIGHMQVDESNRVAVDLAPALKDTGDRCSILNLRTCEQHTGAAQAARHRSN